MRDSIVVDTSGSRTNDSDAVDLGIGGTGLAHNQSGQDIVDADGPLVVDSDIGRKVLSCDRWSHDMVDDDGPPGVDLDAGGTGLSYNRWGQDTDDDDGREGTGLVEEEDDTEDEDDNKTNRVTSFKERRMPSPTSSVVSLTSSVVEVSSPPRMASRKRQRTNTNASAASREGSASTVTSPISSESHHNILTFTSTTDLCGSERALKRQKATTLDQDSPSQYQSFSYTDTSGAIVNLAADHDSDVDRLV